MRALAQSGGGQSKGSAKEATCGGQCTAAYKTRRRHTIYTQYRRNMTISHHNKEPGDGDRVWQEP